MPIVDTAYQKGDTDGGFGIILDESADAFTVEKTADEELAVLWNDKKVIFKKDRIILDNCKFNFTPCMFNTKIVTDNSVISYEYKDNNYALTLDGASLFKDGDTIVAEGTHITLIPTKI